MFDPLADCGGSIPPSVGCGFECTNLANLERIIDSSAACCPPFSTRFAQFPSADGWSPAEIWKYSSHFIGAVWVRRNWRFGSVVIRTIASVQSSNFSLLWLIDSISRSLIRKRERKRKNDKRCEKEKRKKTVFFFFFFFFFYLFIYLFYFLFYLPDLWEIS